MAKRIAQPALKTQYEEFPYPPRDPGDERHRLLKTMLDGVPCINHFVFGGKLDPRKKFRALIAGGGTGDSLLYLAQQLHDLGIAAEITYVDLSDAARGIAQARAQLRGLDNISFETGSLLKLRKRNYGRFDYINCTGVLHHLDDPLEGLRALARGLGPRGGIGLMLYAGLGRTGVYPMQQMLRVVAPDSLPSASRIERARRLIKNLPDSNWLKRNTALADYQNSDTDLFDMLLNKKDRPYSVEEAADLAEQAGLRIVAFVPPFLHKPATFLQDPEILAELSRLSPVEQAAFSEKLYGNLGKLVFYAVRRDNPVQIADPADRSLIPVLGELPPARAISGERAELALTGPYFYGTAQIAVTAAKMIALIDGRRSLDEIRGQLGMNESQFDETLHKNYPFLHEYGYLHLAAHSLNLNSSP